MNKKEETIKSMKERKMRIRGISLMRKQGTWFKIKRKEGEKRSINTREKVLNKTPANIYTLVLFSITHFKGVIKYVVNKCEIVDSSSKCTKPLIFLLFCNILKPDKK